MTGAGAVPLLRLAAGAVRVVVSPHAGGAIAQFALESGGALIDILRPPSAAALADGNARGLGCFPLVPFSNRIGLARFRFDGRDYQLNRNFPPEPNAIHGDAWQHPWQVETAVADRTVLSYRHDGAEAGGAGWPFRYRVEQRIAVDPNGLTVELATTNLEAFAWPFGCGLHPYFRQTPAMRLTAALPAVWLWDTLKLPVARLATPPAWDFSAGRRPLGLNLDHCFAGWDGRVRIEWPELRLALGLTADSATPAPIFRHLVIAVLPDPLQPQTVAIEPVSNANDGVNLLARGEPDHGMVMIEPAATITGRVRFSIERLGA